MKNILIPLATGVAGLCIGAGLMSLTTEPPTGEPARVAPAPARRTPAPQAVIQDDSALQACQGQLALLQGLWDLSVTEASGKPVAFPDDLPEPYGPQAYAANVDTAILACPELQLEAAFVDCEEYPCIAWVTSPLRKSLDDCPAWNEIYENAWASKSSGGIPLEEGERPFVAVGELADDITVAGGSKNRGKRVKQRFERGRARLMDDWGGVELTEAQRKQRQIEFWQAKAEAGDEQAAMMLEMLRP